MPKALAWINGRKAYIAAVLGGLCLVAHKLGIPIPGVEVNDDAITQNLWMLFFASAFAHKLQKIMDAVNNEEKDK